MVSSQFLWYLIQIDKYNSFSLAAEKIHISQPSLSIAIKKLEEQLDLKLIDRQYHKTELTADGKRVVELAKEAFELFEQIENFAKEKKETQTPTLDDLTIYCAPTYVSLLTEISIELFNRQKSTLRVSIINSETDIDTILSQNDNTLVLAVLRENALPPQNFKILPLQQSKSYIMASKHSPLFPISQTSVSFKELLKVPIILTDNAAEIQNVLLDTLKKHGEPTITAVAPDVHSLAAMIDNDLGVCFANRLGLDKNANLSNIRYLLIRNAPKFKLCLFYTEQTPEEKVLLLQEIIQKHLN